MSRDVFPRRNLPGDAEQWGRKVEDRIVAGESSEVQLTQVVNNMGRATSGQLATLSNQMANLLEQQSSLEQQQRDLVGRVSFFSNNGAGSFSAPGTYNITGNSIEFSLSERRVIQVSQSTSATANSPSSVAVGFLLLRVDGTLIQRGPTHGTTVITSPLAGQVATPLAASSLFELPAGDHTIIPVLSTQGTGNVTFQESFITVNVLQVVT